MSRHYVQVRRLLASLGIVAALAASGELARAQYSFVRDGDTSDTWDNAARWLDGGANTTYPNAPDATVLITAPTTTQALSGNNPGYTLSIPTDVTVGHLTINNASYNNAYRTFFGNNAGHLRFQSTSGPATYTETIGSAPGATNSQYQFNAVVDLLSDLVINHDNYPNLNTGTIFSNLVSGASNLTLTKTGHGGLQFNYNHLPTEAPFQGNVVINQGGIRLLSVNPFSSVSGVTVNSGGQLMLADNANNSSNFAWTFGGGVLNLNGAGKATDSPQSVINPEGALRIAVAQVSLTDITSPVVLQSDSVISVPTASITGLLSNTVSGPGGLTKHGAGTLVLDNGANTYQGDTRILGGKLSIASPFLNNSADVYLTTGGVFELNFSGVDTIRSLFVDGVPQPVGTYDAADLGGLLIAGAGSLQVSTLPVTNDADFDGDGDVDGDDFLTWQRGLGSSGGQSQGNANGDAIIDAADLAVWKTQFGTIGATGGAAAVPEPATALLAALALSVLAYLKRI